MLHRKCIGIYLAGSIELRFLMHLFDLQLREFLVKNYQEENQDFQITSDWYATHPVDNLLKRAEIDFNRIDRSQLLIGFFPYDFATVAELSYAIGQGKRVIYCSNKINLDEMPLGIAHTQVRSRASLHHVTVCSFPHKLKQMVLDTLVGLKTI